MNDISKEEEQILLHNTAKEMVSEKMNISLISKITKLPEKEIQKICEKL